MHPKIILFCFVLFEEFTLPCSGLTLPFLLKDHSWQDLGCRESTSRLSNCLISIFTLCCFSGPMFTLFIPIFEYCLKDISRSQFPCAVFKNWASPGEVETGESPERREKFQMPVTKANVPKKYEFIYLFSFKKDLPL